MPRSQHLGYLLREDVSQTSLCAVTTDVKMVTFGGWSGMVFGS
jgi:hypothetical protein